MPALAPLQPGQIYSSWLQLTAASIGVLMVLALWGGVVLVALPRLRLHTSRLVFWLQSLLYGVLLFSIWGFVGIYLRITLPMSLLVGSCVLLLFWGVARRFAAAYTLPPHVAVTADDSRYEAWTLLVIVAGSLLWSLNSIEGMTVRNGQIVLAPWADFIFHAKQISGFAQFEGDPGSLHLTMAGLPQRPYHYGSYIVPALISALTGVHSMQVATSIYPVMGMLLTGAAIIVLTTVLGGAGAALLASVLLFLLPDPSFWLPGVSRFHSYFFFQQIATSGACGVATMGLALACAMRAFQIRSLFLSVTAMIVFAMAGHFKVQILLAYALFFFPFVIWSSDWVQKSVRLACVVAFVAVFVLALSHMVAVPSAPTFDVSFDGIRNNVITIADRLIGRPSLPVALAAAPLAVALVFIAEYGPLLVAALLFGWTARADPTQRNTLRLLACILASHACVRILVGDNRGFGDGAEINRKTFVWPYFVVVSAVAALGWSHVAAAFRSLRSGSSAALLVGAALAAASLVCAPRLQNGLGRDGAWAMVPVPQGLWDAAHYLRDRARANAVVQLCENDSANRLAALSERPNFVSLIWVYAKSVSATEQARFAIVNDILAQPDATSAAAGMNKAHIEWLVMSPKCASKWADQVTPAFVSGGYKLYQASAL